MNRSCFGVCLALVILCLAGSALAETVPGTQDPSASGVVVEEVEEGFAAHKAGLRPGDILLRWQRAASPPANPVPLSGAIDSPVGLLEVETEQAPRGDLTVLGVRDRENLRVLLAPGEWKLRTRPQLDGSELATYEKAYALVAAGEVEKGLSLWRELASLWGQSGAPAKAAWLFLRIASAAGEKHDWQVAGEAFEEAQSQAEAGGEVRLLAVVAETQAGFLEARSELELASAAYREALETRQGNSPTSLGVAGNLNHLGWLAFLRGDLASAHDFFSRSLVLREKLAPRSLETADSLGNLGIVAGVRSDFATAEVFFQRALALQEKLVPEGLEVAKSLNSLGNRAQAIGDLATAEDFFRRSLVIREKLTPGSLEVAKNLNNLGITATNRGDLASAEDFYRHSLAIRQELAPRSLDVAMSLNNLGILASGRGDLGSAEDYFHRSLALQEKLAPQSLDVTWSLTNLGNTAERRGDLAAAEAFYHRSLAIREKLARQSVDVAIVLRSLGIVSLERQDFAAAEDYLARALALFESLAPRSVETAEAFRIQGDIALARADLKVAEARYERSLSIRRERSPGSANEAESCQRLATLNRRRGDLDQALSFYDCATEALEAQRGKLGGSDEARSGFGAEFASTYRQAIDLLVEVGRNADAFHMLERYRARELLSLLATRDLVFSSDLPVELESRRRIANRSYDQAFGRWMRLSDQTNSQERQSARQELEEARRRQNEVRAEVRAASPRLATLHNPQPLDLDATGTVLDAGTLLLSYSVGETRSTVFAVGPQPGELRVHQLAVGEESLRGEVERFRDLVGRGRVDRRPEKVQAHGKRLSDQLLAPVAAQIGQAERLLILADGPLHSLPFAALTDPTTSGGRRFLVEAKPIHFAASATVFGLLKQQRSKPRATQLTAFGDPRYPIHASRDQDAPPRLYAALRSGLDLAPLPATRSEVESLREIYPKTSRIYLGAEATEEKAKAIDEKTTHLHIASHGLLDNRFPLDSALAFSIPQQWREGQDNGLLQAWEIFEQVRIDADLVTLSACDTGLGKVLGGEGLMGLTWAFQYAGARSVFASLWSVSDESTGELMKLFYGYLEEGQSKASALRSAQLDLLRDSPFSHPFHWASFQLIGDWR